MKKFICILLTFTVICSMFAACTSDKTGGSSDSGDSGMSNVGSVESSESVEETPALEDIFDWQNVDGGIEITKYKGNSKTIEVPEIIENKKVVSVGTAFEGNVVVETLILPKYVKEINLTECESLKRVEWTATIISPKHGDFKYVSWDAYIFPESIEELILPNLGHFDTKWLGTKTGSFIELRTLEIPVAIGIEPNENPTIKVDMENVVISKDINCYDSLNRDLRNLENDLIQSDVERFVTLTDSNRETMYKTFFGENCKVTTK